MKNKAVIFNKAEYRLIAKAQKVGDGCGWFVYRNLYEPLRAKRSAFLERVSIPLTGSIDSEKSRNLIDADTIRKHSVPETGLFFDGIEQSGIELYLTSQPEEGYSSAG
jgi:hypothetical protein